MQGTLSGPQYLQPGGLFGKAKRAGVKDSGRYSIQVDQLKAELPSPTCNIKHSRTRRQSIPPPRVQQESARIIRSEAYLVCNVHMQSETPHVARMFLVYGVCTCIPFSQVIHLHFPGHALASPHNQLTQSIIVVFFHVQKVIATK